MGLNKCIGYVDETHIKARMTNKFSGYKEVKKIKPYNEKVKKNVTLIAIEIFKKDWLKNSEILCSKYPELYSD